MYKDDNKYGVLNDFDLSTIMNPGDRNPNRQGLERTGTLPFMAVELLHTKGFDGLVPRRYDHELESFSWVLVWVSRCVLGGQESERPPRLEEWLDDNNDQVYKSKLAFALEQRDIPSTPDYETLGLISESWVDIWARYLAQRKNRRPRTLPPEKTDTEHLQGLIAACEECAHEDPLAAVPIDVTWINSLADLEFTVPTHLPTAPPHSTVVQSQLFLQRSDGEQSTMDGGEMDMSDDDMYVEDDLPRPPDDTEFEDTDGDDDRQSGRSTDAHTSQSPENNNEG